MTDDHLEHQLSTLADELFPPAPALVGGVIAELARRREPRRRWLAAVALAAAVVVAVLALPGPRQALARLLGIGGVTIEQVTDYELPATMPTEEPLGRPADLEEASDLVGFTPRIPQIAGLTDPATFVRPDTADGLVSLVYRNDGEEAGLIITQFRAAGDVAIKQVGNGSSFREVTIAGQLRAFWIEGTHSIVFVGDDGIIEDSARLVGDTLLWEEDGFTYRIESALPLAEVLTIARSMR